MAKFRFSAELFPPLLLEPCLMCRDRKCRAVKHLRAVFDGSRLKAQHATKRERHEWHDNTSRRTSESFHQDFFLWHMHLALLLMGAVEWWKDFYLWKPLSPNDRSELQNQLFLSIHSTLGHQMWFSLQHASSADSWNGVDLTSFERLALSLVCQRELCVALRMFIVCCMTWWKPARQHHQRLASWQSRSVVTKQTLPQRKLFFTSCFAVTELKLTIQAARRLKNEKNFSDMEFDLPW